MIAALLIPGPRGEATTDTMHNGLCSGCYSSSGSVTVRPGDDVLIHCDCGISAGTLVVWYRNCSHLHQPTLVLKLRTKYSHNLRNNPESWMTPMPRFRFVRNYSTDSYDLQITNVTEAEEGWYFCGTETQILKDEGGQSLQKSYLYVYGNLTTRVTLIAPGLDWVSPVLCHPPFVSWVALASAAAVLLFNILFILLYHSCQKKDAAHTRANQMDQCYSTVVQFGTSERKIQ